eukprot:SAG11_NODE_823_length_6997_cov_60.301247_2_plen_68_part_00
MEQCFPPSIIEPMHEVRKSSMPYILLAQLRKISPVRRDRPCLLPRVVPDGLAELKPRWSTLQALQGK